MLIDIDSKLHDLRCETCGSWVKIGMCNTQKGRCKKMADFSFGSDIHSAGIPWQVWESIRIMGCASHSNVNTITYKKE